MSIHAPNEKRHPFDKNRNKSWAFGRNNLGIMFTCLLFSLTELLLSMIHDLVTKGLLQCRELFGLDKMRLQPIHSRVVALITILPFQDYEDFVVEQACIEILFCHLRIQVVTLL